MSPEFSAILFIIFVLNKHLFNKKMRYFCSFIRSSKHLGICTRFCLLNGFLFSGLGFNWGCGSESPYLDGFQCGLWYTGLAYEGFSYLVCVCVYFCSYIHYLISSSVPIILLSSGMPKIKWDLRKPRQLALGSMMTIKRDSKNQVPGSNRKSCQVSNIKRNSPVL